MFKKYVSDLKAEFKGYNGKKLTQDLMAGLCRLPWLSA